MKTPISQTWPFKSILGRPLLALAIAALIIATAPAFADDHGNNKGNWNNGRGNGGYKGNNGHHGNKHGYYGNRGRYQPPYYPPAQTQRYIYSPPPVYYPPMISPGLNLVLPIHIR